MIVMSYNIRGGNVSKRKRVSFSVRSQKVDVLFIQETKISLLNDAFAKSFWGSDEFDWSARNSIRAARGCIYYGKRTFWLLITAFQDLVMLV